MIDGESLLGVKLGILLHAKQFTYNTHARSSNSFSSVVFHTTLDRSLASFDDVMSPLSYGSQPPVFVNYDLPTCEVSCSNIDWDWVLLVSVPDRRSICAINTVYKRNYV